MIRSTARRRTGGRVAWLTPIRFLAFALCGNPTLFAGVRPVSPALTAAALGSGWPLPLVLAAAAVSCLSGGWSAQALCSLLGDMLAAALLSLPWTRSRLQKDGLREGLVCLAAFAGGCTQLLTLGSGFTAYALIACLSGALTAAMLSPCLLGALSLRAGRKRLLPDEQLSVILWCALAVGGLSTLPLLGEWLGGAAAALLVLLGAGGGAANGALCGVCIGLSMAAREANLAYAAALGLSGALSGALRRVNRGAMGAALLAGSVLGVVYGGLENWALPLLPAAGGCLLFLCLPGGWVAAIREALSPQAVSPDVQTLSIRLRRETARQVGRLAHAFEGLEQACGAEKAPLPNEVALIRQMREALCEGCEDYARCWRGERSQAGRLLCRMMSEAVAGKPLTSAAQLPPDQTRHCRRSTQIDRRVQPVLARFVEERDEALRTSGMRALLCRQTGQTARLLAHLSAQLTRPICVDEDCARLAQAAFEKCGLRCPEVLAVGGDRLELFAVPAGGFTDAQARTAAAQLSEELGQPFRSEPCPENPSCLHFTPMPRCELVSAAAQTPAQGETACGDCCRVSELPDGRMLMALCDGMGNGETARAQSEAALELIGRLLTAGVALDLALSSVNGALLSREKDCFTTLDLCVLDPLRGTADFCKLGAAASVILRADAIEWVPGGRLPMGVLEEVTPARQRRVLREGETVVLFSDGVADDLRDGQAQWLSDRLPALRDLPLERAASLLLEQAQARDGGRARDDMTVLMARLRTREGFSVS